MNEPIPTDEAWPWLTPDYASPEGIVGVGGDLTVATMLEAYRNGIFPWFNDGDPVIWWCPDPRAIIPMDTLHIPKRLKSVLKSGRFRHTLNQDFEGVIRGCRDVRIDEGTWITEEVVEAYCELHRLGHAHSLEVWEGDLLAGGIYGVAIGGCFAGESMFYRVPEASKCALVWMVEHLLKRGYVLFDTQIINEHTERFGAIDIPRDNYMAMLHEALLLKDVRFA